MALGRALVIAPSTASAAAATALGWGLTAGSVGLYAPIMLNLAKARTADGLSATTWGLQTAVEELPT